MDQPMAWVLAFFLSVLAFAGVYFFAVYKTRGEIHEAKKDSHAHPSEGYGVEHADDGHGKEGHGVERADDGHGKDESGHHSEGGSEKAQPHHDHEGKAEPAIEGGEANEYGLDDNGESLEESAERAEHAESAEHH